jgi:hypothetical protein
MEAQRPRVSKSVVRMGHIVAASNCLTPFVSSADQEHCHLQALGASLGTHQPVVALHGPNKSHVYAVRQSGMGGSLRALALYRFHVRQNHPKAPDA